MYNNYDTMFETQSYAIKESSVTSYITIVRKIDNHECYLSDRDAGMLYYLYTTGEIDEFTIICNSFQYIDPVQERSIC